MKFTILVALLFSMSAFAKTVATCKDAEALVDGNLSPLKLNVTIKSNSQGKLSAVGSYKGKLFAIKKVSAEEVLNDQFDKVKEYSETLGIDLKNARNASIYSLGPKGENFLIVVKSNFKKVIGKIFMIESQLGVCK